jgi:hypothetical protein
VCQGLGLCVTVCVCVCSTYYKAVRVGEGNSGGNVLRETTSRGLGGLVCPSPTRERGGAHIDGWRALELMAPLFMEMMMSYRRSSETI